MPKIKIDGKELEVPAGKTVLQAALDAGVFVPHYCYHPKLSIAGNCRMCLVEVVGRPKLEISCNLMPTEGMEIKTQSPVVLNAQKSVLEFILINHPLDCPICDQAGECKLQDYYFAHSAVPSRFEEEKVHKPKATPLGERVMLDDERCILCSRCVRFCSEVAKEDELCISHRGDHSTLTTFKGEPMKNPYSINTVDICPVGALTSTDFRFNKRVWFLSKTKSICTGCATGCNIEMDHEGGVVYRYRPRENEAVNQCWMCDEGRLTYKFINEDRILSPYLNLGGSWERTRWEEALETLRAGLENCPAAERGIVLSAQLSNEEIAAWMQLGQTWGAKIFGTRRTVKNPTEDQILRNADKNPNSFTLKTLQLGAYAAGCKALIVVGELGSDDAAAIAKTRPAFVAAIASNHLEAHTFANVVLPLATFAEQEGSFTNVQGHVQAFHRAFPPRGESLPAWKIATMV